jgi:phasin family protein
MLQCSKTAKQPNRSHTMTVNPEQFAAANKAALDNLVTLTQQAFKGMEQLVELNMAAARNSLDETAEKAKAALGVKDAQEFMNLQATLLQPAQDKAVAYGRQVADIAAATQAEVTKLAEAQVKAAQEQFQSMVDAATKSAPAGSEQAVAAVRTAMANTQAAFDTVQKAAKQAVSVAEANFKTLSNTAESTAKAAAEAVKKSTKR